MNDHQAEPDAAPPDASDPSVARAPSAEIEGTSTSAAQQELLPQTAEAGLDRQAFGAPLAQRKQELLAELGFDIE